MKVSNVRCGDLVVLGEDDLYFEQWYYLVLRVQDEFIDMLALARNDTLDQDGLIVQIDIDIDDINNGWRLLRF